MCIRDRDMVRPGICLYGIYPGPDRGVINLKPVMELKTRIVHIKEEVEPGYSISYGRTYKAPAKRKIAVLPIGYADGLHRVLSNQLEVLVHGKRVKQVGRICMDCLLYTSHRSLPGACASKAERGQFLRFSPCAPYSGGTDPDRRSQYPPVRQYCCLLYTSHPAFRLYIGKSTGNDCRRPHENFLPAARKRGRTSRCKNHLSKISGNPQFIGCEPAPRFRWHSIQKRAFLLSSEYKAHFKKSGLLHCRSGCAFLF